jgi:iron complex transport system substrate-binding protein
LAADPDVIVVGGSNWDPEGNIMRLGFYASSEGASEHLSLYLKRPGWSDLTAIKKGRLHAIHYNYYGRPYNFAGFETMAKFLYPQEFADLNPEKDLADFFEKYMPFSYSGTFSADWVHK